MSLPELHAVQGAALAADSIPLHYGDLRAEYQAALQAAVLMDRSHEGRLEAAGGGCFDLIQRMSTNDVLGLSAGEGRPTIFTNPNGRILDRVMVYSRDGAALLITEAGRGAPLLQYLQRNIFFNDDVRLNDLADSTHLFALHGPQADAIIENLSPGTSNLTGFNGMHIWVDGAPVFAARRKPISGAHWVLIAPLDQAESVWQAVLECGQAYGLRLAGSLTYNTLRIRAGRPAARSELTTDYIPLEVGLWDEVSFNKGCYTGQEIIARMESRSRLAKVLVRLRLEQFVQSPAALYEAGKTAGTLTSSVTTPDGEHLGLGFIRFGLAVPGSRLTVGETGVTGLITGLAGSQPARPDFSPPQP
ncbi:MAG: glycine cleavage system protein T [Chloroflexi bacterium]|nr:glycine cleavage system protein T [Chloroflexota bacterium]MDL1882758.1 glycine cleavage system protein T [Anaerolineae bacterium CFX8]